MSHPRFVVVCHSAVAGRPGFFSVLDRAYNYALIWSAPFRSGKQARKAAERARDKLEERYGSIAW